MSRCPPWLWASGGSAVFRRRPRTGARQEAFTHVTERSGVCAAVVRATGSREQARDGIAAGVVDQGRGNDPAATRGVDIAHSTRAPIEAAGGTARFESTPGQGHRVRLWVPCTDT